jgi:monothiol glutaredoxin
MRPEVKERLDHEIKSHPVVLYMKGNALFPRCGFSAAALAALQPFAEVYTVDVLEDPEIRDAIKEYSSWPTIPQVYIHGRFIGGSDIVRQLYETGELERLIRTA